MRRLAGSLFFVALLLLCACAPVVPPVGDEPLPLDATGVRGRVSRSDGSPATGAYVYAYRSSRQGLRGPADFGVRVDPDGRYFLDLVSGTYHLVARLRHTGADSGPPRPGDAWSVYPRNPVTIGSGEITEIDFKLSGSDVPRQIREGSLTSGDTGFRGRLVDRHGEALAGAFALAYRSADFHRMPDFTSAPADADGQFVLYVPDPGTYCLAARSKTRGQPRSGEPYGILAPGEKGCVAVTRGEIREIGEIVLTPHP